MTPSTEAVALHEVHLEGRIQTERFVVTQGECVVLCGPNGSGKSSLLRLVAGLELKGKGEIRIAGDELRRLSRLEIAARVAWLPQRPSITEALTCRALVAAARFRFMESPARAEMKAAALLKEHDATHLENRLISQISGGELQRVLLAALNAQEAPILLVDEPANHLDPQHQVATYKRLGQLWQKEKRTLLIVSHDLRLAKLLGPPASIRVIGILSGQISEDTTLADPKLPAALQRLYGLPFVGADEAGAFSVDLSGEMSPWEEGE